MMKLRFACTLVFLLPLVSVTRAQQTTEYSIDPRMSKLEINAYREGLLKAFSHDHLIEAREVSGSVEFDAKKIENSSVRLTVEAKSLTVIDPGESEKDRREVQSTMTGEKVLDASKFPEIVFSSTSVSDVRQTADGWELTLNGKLDLHGVEKPVRFLLHVYNSEAGQLRAQGEASLLQTEYGIKPVTVGGGSVKVKDKLKISFAIAATRTNL
jgi:polyisoprenoid-binding protein YceI